MTSIIAARTVDATVAETATTTAARLSSALVAGASLSGGISAAVAAAGANYRVVCGIEIENYTKWPMTTARSSMELGYFQKPPTEIQPGMKEGFVCHKNPKTPSGIFGTFSWHMGETNQLVVMVSCPFFFDIFFNYLAVGVLQTKVIHNPKWTNEMCRETETYFKRGKYYSTADPIHFEGGGVKVVGMMGTSQKTEAKVSVFPIRWDDLAAPMKELVNKNDYKI